MLKRLLTTAGTLGLLLCGATVGLEAVGVLFRTGTTADPEQQRVAALLARLEAEFSPVDLPIEPVEFPTDVAQEAPSPNTEAVAPADLTPNADVRVAEGLQPADPATDSVEQVALAPTGRVESPLPGGDLQPEAGPEPAQPEPAPEPEPPVIREIEPVAAQPPAQLAVETTDAPAAAASARPQRLGGARRTRAAEPVGRYVSFGWPFLDWLDAVIYPPRAPVTPTAAGRASRPRQG
jgi:hypothetical protein